MAYHKEVEYAIKCENKKKQQQEKPPKVRAESKDNHGQVKQPYIEFSESYG